MQVTIYRYNPDCDQKPSYKTYDVDTSKISGIMLLDILEYIKANLDDSLAFRRSCGGGVCGSDGININGRNSLACVTPFKDLPEKVTLRPLPGMPIIRDLIVNLDQFYAQYESVKPYLQSHSHPEKEYIQSIEQRDQLDGLYECILCACCSSSCPSFWWNPDKFVGPAGLLAAARFVLDSRDDEKESRLKDLDDLYRLYRCRSIMNCTTVCPKGLNPNEAISKIRDEMIKSKTQPKETHHD
jgi:succinate dehydrogenase / fumarate reductase iron-sulfur subunit